MKWGNLVHSHTYVKVGSVKEGKKKISGGGVALEEDIIGKHPLNFIYFKNIYIFKNKIN